MTITTGLYMSFIPDTNQLQQFIPSNNHIVSCYWPPLLTLALDLGLSACILELGENSGESLPGTKLAVAEKKDCGKATELNSQNCPQWAQESPQAIAGGLEVPKEGGIGPAAQKWGLRAFRTRILKAVAVIGPTTAVGQAG